MRIPNFKVEIVTVGKDFSIQPGDARPWPWLAAEQLALPARSAGLHRRVRFSAMSRRDHARVLR